MTATDRPIRFLDISQSALSILLTKDGQPLDLEHSLFQNGRRNLDIDSMASHCITRYADKENPDQSATEKSPERADYKIKSLSSEFSTSALRNFWTVKFHFVPSRPGLHARPLNVDCFGQAQSGLEELSIRDFESIFGGYVGFTELKIYAQPARPDTWASQPLSPRSLKKFVTLEAADDLVSEEINDEKQLRFQSEHVLGARERIDATQPLCTLKNQKLTAFSIPQGTKISVKEVSRHFYTSHSGEAQKWNQKKVLHKPSFVMELSASIEGREQHFTMNCENSTLRDPPDYPELQHTTGKLMLWTWREETNF